MHARVTTGQFQPGTLDQFIRDFESVTPQLKGLQGFVSTQLLTDRAANTCLVVTLYETLADLEAGGTLFQQMLADPRVTAALAGPPAVAVYEVAVRVP
jgi:heme-degrading monooxygenase HmoA